MVKVDESYLFSTEKLFPSNVIKEIHFSNSHCAHNSKECLVENTTPSDFAQLNVFQHNYFLTMLILQFAKHFI
jgi:hypothetical protein